MASVGLPLLVVITAVAGVTGTRVLLAVALIGALAVPVALWTLDRIRADMGNGRVIRVTGIPSVLVEDNAEDCVVRVVLKGRRFRLPCSAASIVNQPGPISAYFTPWSGMLVNVAKASPTDDWTVDRSG
jgi:hypothetical protein